MGWANKLNWVYRTGMRAALDMTSTSLSICGSFASAAGGACYVLSHALHKEFEAGYYLQGLFEGQASLSSHIKSFNLEFNYSTPIAAHHIEQDGYTYSLRNYFDPLSFWIASAACVGLGIGCNLLSASIRKIQQQHEDKKRHADQSVLISKIPNQELVLLYSQALSHSLSISLFSCSIVGCILFYTSYFKSDLQFHYPFLGNVTANSSYYSGPLAKKEQYIDFEFDPKNVLVDFPFIGNVSILLKPFINGMLNTTYGAGIYFKEDKTSPIRANIIVATSASLGVIASLAHSFFARREKTLREQRVFDAPTTQYTVLP